MPTNRLEGAAIDDISYDTLQAKVTVRSLPDRPGIAGSLFRLLANHDINLDVIVQNSSVHGTTDISFTVPRGELPTALDLTTRWAQESGHLNVDADDNIAILSVRGAGLTNAYALAPVFEALADEGINIEMILSSPAELACVIPEASAEAALRALRDVQKRFPPL